MSQKLEFPTGLQLGEGQHVKGATAVISRPAGADGSIRKEMIRVQNAPTSVDTGINSVRVRVQEAMRPKFGRFSWLAKREFDNAQSTSEIQVAPGTFLKMRLSPGEDGALVWADSGEDLTPEKARQYFPHAGSMEQRGQAVLLKDLLANMPKEKPEDTPQGEMITDLGQALRIHEHGRLKVMENMKYGVMERNIAGLSILSAAELSKDICWGHIDDHDTIVSLEDRQTSVQNVGWMVLVPHDSPMNSTMKLPYEMRTLDAKTQIVLIRAFNTTPEWSGIMDARYKVHLHDAMAGLEHPEDAPTDYKSLYGDFRGFSAQIAAVELVSNFQYLALLDEWIAAKGITMKDVLTMLQHDTEYFQEFRDAANAVITKEPARSADEQGARNGLHLVALGMRIIEKDSTIQDKRKAGIQFMRRIRGEMTRDSFDATQN